MSLSRRDSDAGFFTGSFVSGSRTDVRSSSLRSWGSVSPFLVTGGGTGRTAERCPLVFDYRPSTGTGRNAQVLGGDTVEAPRTHRHCGGPLLITRLTLAPCLSRRPGFGFSEIT